MTLRQIVEAGWRISLNPEPSDFIVSKDGPGRFSYVGHHGNCYIEGTARSWADLERKLTERHENAVRNGVIHARSR